MRRLLLIMLLPVLLVVGCTREADRPADDALYARYASRTGLAVAKVCNFSLNDSVCVDVVLLQAEDDEEWQQLKEEFDIRGDEGTVSYLADPASPATRVCWDGEPVLRVIASHSDKAIGLYRLENETQYDAQIDYQLNKINK